MVFGISVEVKWLYLELYIVNKLSLQYVWYFKNYYFCIGCFGILKCYVIGCFGIFKCNIYIILILQYFLNKYYEVLIYMYFVDI